MKRLWLGLALVLVVLALTIGLLYPQIQYQFGYRAGHQFVQAALAHHAPNVNQALMMLRLQFDPALRAKSTEFRHGFMAGVEAALAGAHSLQVPAGRLLPAPILPVEHG